MLEMTAKCRWMPPCQWLQGQALRLAGMTCWGWPADDHCWGACEDPIDAGFRPGSRALAYRILKGATISWYVPKGTTTVVTQKDPTQRFCSSRRINNGCALRDAPSDGCALRDAAFTVSPRSPTLQRADVGQWRGGPTPRARLLI